MFLIYNEKNYIIGVTNIKKPNTVEYRGDAKIPYNSFLDLEKRIIYTPQGDSVDLDTESKEFFLEEI